MGEVTKLLGGVPGGEGPAAAELLPLVYEELRKMAAAKMAREAGGHTLQATALMHEAWLRLVKADGSPQFENRAHFFGAAAEAMRRILVEAARRKKRVKHGGALERSDVDILEVPLPVASEDLLALNDALDRLADLDGQAAEVVKLCFFVGLTQEETARELGLSLATVERRWSFARAWLLREIESGREGEDRPEGKPKR